jgi:hypothetical protein
VGSNEHWMAIAEDRQAMLIELIEAGEMIAAVKGFRAQTGLGLAGSQAAIDAVTVGADSPPSDAVAASVPLSHGTTRRLRLLFESPLHDEATTMLEGLVAPGMGDTPEALERVRFAALRLSKGTLAGLSDARELAHIDWRDLLVAAEFGEDPTAHERWLT